VEGEGGIAGGWVEIRGLVAGNPGSSEPTSQLSRICIQIALFFTFFLLLFRAGNYTKLLPARASERKEGGCVHLFSRRCRRRHVQLPGLAIVSHGPRRETALFRGESREEASYSN